MARDAQRVIDQIGNGTLDQRSGSNDFGVMADRKSFDGRTGTGWRDGSELADLFGPIGTMADAEIERRGRIVAGRGQEGRTVDRRSDAWSGSLVNGQGFGWDQGITESIFHGRRSTVTGANSSDGRAMDHAIGAGWEGFVGNVDRGDGSSFGSASNGSVAAANGGVVADRDITVVRHVASTGKFAVDESDVELCERDDPDGYGGRLVRALADIWSDAEWIVCHDGKKRRTKPGIRLLVNGIPGRVDLWSIAGNAIVPASAALAIEAIREVLDGDA